ncbi:MAG: hypothetical protein JXA36_02455 [Coriobacteriia bacterium]|nr:hypothetical protein [Coriobacteriia bacterium]
MLQEWMPYIIIAAIALALVVLTVVLARLAWRRQVRRFIVGLVSYREAIGAALKTVESVVATLAQGSVAEVLQFAEEASEERRAIGEIAERMRMEKSELADLALPKKLWRLADTLGDAASALAEQAGRVGDAKGDAVLDALSALEFGPTRALLEEADGEIASVSVAYKMTDSAVYGGGLYI